MKTRELATLIGDIAAHITETRLATGGRRYGVVFHRDVGDLALAGPVTESLGQHELWDLIRAAAEAYQAIDRYRTQPYQGLRARFDTMPFEQLTESDGWHPGDIEFFGQEVEEV